MSAVENDKPPVRITIELNCVGGDHMVSTFDFTEANSSAEQQQAIYAQLRALLALTGRVLP